MPRRSEEPVGSDRKRPLWTAQELDVLREMYSSDTCLLEEVERELPGRTRDAIRLKASRRGLHRPVPDVPEDPEPKLDMYNTLVPKNETNPVYYILRGIKFTLSTDTMGSPFTAMRPSELDTDLDTNLEQVGRILSTRDLRRMAWYFLDYGAATAAILLHRLEISQTATYRYLKDLKTLSFIMPAIKVRSQKGKKGGPRPDVWMVPDATIDMINEAQALHRKLMSPKYVAAESLGQLILEEYLAPRQATEITYREITTRMKELKMPFTTPDIADLAAQYLHEKGIKVWR